MSKQASAAVKAITTISGVKRQQLADCLEITPQAYTNKLSLGRWTADELARVAELCGYSLAIVDNNGRVIVPVLPSTTAE